MRATFSLRACVVAGEDAGASAATAVGAATAAASVEAAVDWRKRRRLSEESGNRPPIAFGSCYRGGGGIVDLTRASWHGFSTRVRCRGLQRVAGHGLHTRATGSG